MGKYIPVEPEKWAEMVKALALVAEMDKTINASQAECRRLKEKSECQAECLEAFDKENARLKAEVERLAMSEGYHYTAIAVSTLKEQLHQKHIDYLEARKANEAKVEMIARLKAEVERLTFDPLTYLDDSGEWMPRHTHLVAVERLKAEVEHLTSENLLVREEADRYCRLWQEAKEGKQS